MRQVNIKKFRTMELKDIMADPFFLAACEKAKVKPTKRQASSFRAMKGMAYNSATDVLKEQRKLAYGKRVNARRK